MAAYWEIAAHSAYDMLSWYKSLSVNGLPIARFLEWEFLSDCAIPDHCLLVPLFHINHGTCIYFRQKGELF